jgi:mannose/fructose/N-acetylgalactosamine-specific phosphotransferase system component IIB
LIHGQVLEAWLPYLKAERVVVADDEAAANPLMRAAMAMAVPLQIEVVLSPLEDTDFEALESDPKRTLVLLRDVAAAVKARAHGLPAGPLNVGNVHAGTGRIQITRSIFLNELERGQLRKLGDEGMGVTLQAVPTEALKNLPS